jgi:hypothetical protein
MSQAGANSTSGGGGGGDILTLTGNSGGPISPIAGNINILGGSTGYTFVGTSGTLTLTGAGTGFTWEAITTSQPLVASHGYFVMSGALSLSLPATSALGDTISVSLEDTGTSWTITQAAGQKIRVGNISSTVGVGGSVSSTQPGDTITIVSYSNGLWQATSSMGELQII